eukprot:ctg_1837.g537
MPPSVLYHPCVDESAGGGGAGSGYQSREADSRAPLLPVRHAGIAAAAVGDVGADGHRQTGVDGVVAQHGAGVDAVAVVGARGAGADAGGAGAGCGTGAAAPDQRAEP